MIGGSKKVVRDKFLEALKRGLTKNVPIFCGNKHHLIPNEFQK